MDYQHKLFGIHTDFLYFTKIKIPSFGFEVFLSLDSDCIFSVEIWYWWYFSQGSKFRLHGVYLPLTGDDKFEDLVLLLSGPSLKSYYFSYLNKQSIGRWGFPCGSAVKNLPLMQEIQRHGFDPWVGKIPWRRKWQPTPEIWPWKSHGQRSLVGYSSWGCKELDTRLNN